MSEANQHRTEQYKGVGKDGNMAKPMKRSVPSLKPSSSNPKSHQRGPQGNG
jgi:hypothetical protein